VPSPSIGDLHRRALEEGGLVIHRAVVDEIVQVPARLRLAAGHGVAHGIHVVVRAVVAFIVMRAEHHDVVALGVGPAQRALEVALEDDANRKLRGRQRRGREGRGGMDGERGGEAQGSGGSLHGRP
jgi:hypothetical protein